VISCVFALPKVEELIPVKSAGVFDGHFTFRFLNAPDHLPAAASLRSAPA